MSGRVLLLALLAITTSSGLALVWWITFAITAPAAKVTILDDQGRHVRTITSEHDLAAFNELWSRRVIAEPGTALKYSYKLQIEKNGRSNSWLYDPAGVTQVLAIHRSPLYLVPSVAEFNALLAVASCPDQSC